MKNQSEPQYTAAGMRWLVMFFGLAYFMQHFAQAGLINQPLSFYFKEVLGFNAVQVTEWLAILTIPWMIKPLYGLVSDFIPLFGYRRKSYLLLLNVLAVGGFIAVSGATSAAAIVTALTVTAFGTAMSDVIIDALMVELGSRTGQTKAFQSQQWLWFNAATVITSLAGGYFADHFGPAQGLHYAALVTVLAPLSMFFASWFAVKEQKSKLNLEQLKTTTFSLWSAMKSRTLWIVAAFLAFWQFSPSFGTPQYFYFTNDLKFSQSFIGQLSAVGAFASVIGAWAYRRYLAPRYSTTQLMYASVFIGTVGTLAYLLIADNAMSAWLSQIVDPRYTAMFLAFTVGGSSIIAFLTTLNLAAEACPKAVEGLTFALLMSVFNLAMQGSSIFGAHLYEKVFNQHLTPLIWVSAAFTFVCFFLVRFLPKNDQTGDDDKGTSA